MGVSYDTVNGIIRRKLQRLQKWGAIPFLVVFAACQKC